MAYSDYTEDLMLKWMCRNTDMPGAPNDVFIALHSAAPDDDASPTNELANANGYARKVVNTGTAGSGSGSLFDAPVAGEPSSCTSNAEIAFNACTGSNWLDVTHFSLWDSGTYGAGNMLGWVALAASKPVTVGDIVRFASGQLSVQMS